MSTENIKKISIFNINFILVIWRPSKITSGGPWPLPGPYGTTPLLQTDASNVGLRAVLAKLDDNGNERELSLMQVAP